MGLGGLDQWRDRCGSMGTDNGPARTGRGRLQRPSQACRYHESTSGRGGHTREKEPMATFTYDHIHLRSPNPEATAQYYERMFGAEVLRTMQQGKPRIDLKLGGVNIFIAQTTPEVNPPPATPYQGLDHFGLSVSNID